MLKPRKQCKRIPITLEAGLLKVLKGRVLQFDILSSEDGYDEYGSYFIHGGSFFMYGSSCFINGQDYRSCFGKKISLSIEEGHHFNHFISLDRLVKRLEEKGVLIYAPYECSTWVVAGDKAAMIKASKEPGPVGLSRRDRERKWRRGQC